MKTFRRNLLFNNQTYQWLYAFTCPYNSVTRDFEEGSNVVFEDSWECIDVLIGNIEPGDKCAGCWCINWEAGCGAQNSCWDLSLSSDLFKTQTSTRGCCAHIVRKLTCGIWRLCHIVWPVLSGQADRKQDRWVFSFLFSFSHLSWQRAVSKY